MNQRICHTYSKVTAGRMNWLCAGRPRGRLQRETPKSLFGLDAGLTR